MTDLTAANAIITLVAPGVFNTPQQLQQFAADDIFNTPAIEAAEKSMGVDGILSAGFVFKEIDQDYNLQSNSPSCFFFDQIYAYEQTNLTKVPINGTTILTGLLTKFVMIRGFLMSYTPIPSAGRIVKPRKYMVSWNRVQPQPS